VAKVLIKNYINALNTAPILVKSVTSGFVYMMGDLCSQLLGKKELKDVSKRRMLGSGAAGLVFHGPVSHTWYAGLDHLIEHTLGWHQWWNIFPMVALDCFLFCPLWNGIYVACMGLTFGRSLKTVAKSVKKTCIPLLKSGLKLWVPANFITYGLVPLPLRVLWCDCVEFVWCIIMA
jgi:protein Mpv17